MSTEGFVEKASSGGGRLSKAKRQDDVKKSPTTVKRALNKNRYVLVTVFSIFIIQSRKCNYLLGKKII